MENNRTKELPKWDDLRTERLPGVELFDKKDHRLVFLKDDPYETTEKHGKPLMIFDVEENQVNKSLFVSSIRLAVKLKRISPLTGKVVVIKRLGEKTDIDYEVSVQN